MKSFNAASRSSGDEAEAQVRMCILDSRWLSTGIITLAVFGSPRSSLRDVWLLMNRGLWR
jgi:hypothetical protein